MKDNSRESTQKAKVAGQRINAIPLPIPNLTGKNLLVRQNYPITPSHSLIPSLFQMIAPISLIVSRIPTQIW